MMENKDNKKKIIIFGVITLIILTLATTFSFYIWNSNTNQDIDVALNLNGLDAYINYKKGTDVLTGTLLPSKDYTGGISTEIELWKSPSAASRTLYGHIYMDITTIGTNLANEPALKWVITSNGKVLNTGDFVGQTEGSYITLDINIPLSTTKQLFQIYIWLDESMEINDQIEGNTLSTKVRAEATEIFQSILASKYISLLSFSNNQLLTNDVLEEIRYTGKNPNNYVLFNNELWRIIGVFDVKSSVDGPYEKRMKIIRNESIGSYSWDNKSAGVGSSISEYGSNDWTDSALMEMLNNGPYWNRTTGICPSGQNGATKKCDFSKIGLTSEAKDLTGDAYWNLGGYSNTKIITSELYTYERSFNVYEGRVAYWIGKVGLMYLSDYGYATSGGETTNRQLCLEYGLNEWYSLGLTDCLNNNYLTSAHQWTINHNSNISYYNYVVMQAGYAGSSNPTNTFFIVRPTLYLKSSVQITGGEGTQNNPYTLG